MNKKLGSHIINILFISASVSVLSLITLPPAMAYKCTTKVDAQRDYDDAKRRLKLIQYKRKLGINQELNWFHRWYKTTFELMVAANASAQLEKAFDEEEARAFRKKYTFVTKKAMEEWRNTEEYKQFVRDFVNRNKEYFNGVNLINDIANKGFMGPKEYLDWLDRLQDITMEKLRGAHECLNRPPPPKEPSLVFFVLRDKVVELALSTGPVHIQAKKQINITMAMWNGILPYRLTIVSGDWLNISIPINKIFKDEYLTLPLQFPRAGTYTVTFTLQDSNSPPLVRERTGLFVVSEAEEPSSGPGPDTGTVHRPPPSTDLIPTLPPGSVGEGVSTTTNCPTCPSQGAPPPAPIPSFPQGPLSASLGCGGSLDLIPGEISKSCDVVVSGWKSNTSERVEIIFPDQMDSWGSLPGQITVFPGSTSDDPSNMFSSGVTPYSNQYAFPKLFSARSTASAGTFVIPIIVRQGASQVQLFLTITVGAGGSSSVNTKGNWCLWSYKLFGDPCPHFVASLCDNERYTKSGSGYQIVGSGLSQKAAEDLMTEKSRYYSNADKCREVPVPTKSPAPPATIPPAPEPEIPGETSPPPETSVPQPPQTNEPQKMVWRLKQGFPQIDPEHWSGRDLGLYKIASVSQSGSEITAPEQDLHVTFSVGTPPSVLQDGDIVTLTLNGQASGEMRGAVGSGACLAAAGFEVSSQGTNADGGIAGCIYVGVAGSTGEKIHSKEATYACLVREGASELGLSFYMGGVGAIVNYQYERVKEGTELAPSGNPLSLMITTGKEIYGLSELISVSYSGVPAGESYYVYLAKAGSSEESYLLWMNAQPGKGVMSFDLQPPGNYEVRLVRQELTTESVRYRVVLRHPFKVGAAGVTLRTDKAVYSSDERISVEFSGVPANEKYYVYLSKAGSQDEDYTAWKTVKAGQETKVLFDEQEPGNYEARIIYQDLQDWKYKALMRSAFKVTGRDGQNQSNSPTLIR